MVKEPMRGMLSDVRVSLHWRHRGEHTWPHLRFWINLVHRLRRRALEE